MVRSGVWILLASVLLATTGSASPAPDEIATKVQAAMVVRFVKYVRWPKKRHAKDDSPIVVGVLDDSAVLAAMKSEADGAKAGSRSIEIVKLETPDDALPPDSWKKCHIIYVGSSSKVQIAKLIELAQKNSVLTVSDRPEFVKTEGGVIEFVVVDKKMKFRVSREAAKASTLRLSSKLLKLGLKD